MTLTKAVEEILPVALPGILNVVLQNLIFESHCHMTKKHRWGDKQTISPHKTERECLNNCGIVKVGRHEWQGGREIHWTEFWRSLERIEGTGTPVCEPIEVNA
jgi:hypothetical protein